MPARSRQKLLTTEVIQTSAMDCGPACLKSFLNGFGVGASYGRLREACQTDLDGTSIDALEDTAVRLGLAAEQKMVPSDHLLLPESGCLPAILVVLRSDRVTHFVLVWRKHGSWVQIMDPAIGRRWVRASELLARAYQHTQAVPAVSWREWAGSDSFLNALRTRMADVGIPKEQCERLIRNAVANSQWQGLAGLDAALRMTAALIAARGLRNGTEGARVATVLTSDPSRVPSRFWSVEAHPSETKLLLMKGVVLMHASSYSGAAVRDLSPELNAALRDPQPGPLNFLWKIIRQEGLVTPVTLVTFSALAAAAVVAQALLFRGLLDISLHLNVRGQRLAALAGMLLFLLSVLLVEWPLEFGILKLGRKLENRFRIWFLEKVPRMADRYFQSRLISDMAQRAHSMHLIRTLPALVEQGVRAAVSLVFTLAGIAWLFPQGLPLAAFAALSSIAVPALAAPILNERDLRRREHEGALSLFYFDALRGLAALRAHGAGRLLRRAHAEKLHEWADAGLRLQRAIVGVEGTQMLIGFSLVVALVLTQFSRPEDASGTLLLVYWALSIPSMGQEIANCIWQYPRIRNVTLRLLEPLGTLEEQSARPTDHAFRSGGVEISIRGATVVASGHAILESIRLDIRAGEHVAIVGRSGAGKSSLVGLLLGWHRAAACKVLIDGEPLDLQRLERLRSETIWVCPEVQLWSGSLYENLLYGRANANRGLGDAISVASLDDVLKKLPEGLNTQLGESGSFISAGEGQRVRIGRALNRDGVRLAILDEPGRGLSHQDRRELLGRLRSRWKLATLLCITHDVLDTCDFDRVLVMEEGRIVEDAVPNEAVRNPGSRYRSLCDAEQMVRSSIWSSGIWRRVRMNDGKLSGEVRGKDHACSAR